MIKDESGLMDEREAKEVRLELMKERTTILEQVEDSDNFLFSRVFNLASTENQGHEALKFLYKSRFKFIVNVRSIIY